MDPSGESGRPVKPDLATSDHAAIESRARTSRYPAAPSPRLGQSGGRAEPMDPRRQTAVESGAAPGSVGGRVLLAPRGDDDRHDVGAERQQGVAHRATPPLVGTPGGLFRRGSAARQTAKSSGGPNLPLLASSYLHYRHSRANA